MNERQRIRGIVADLLTLPLRRNGMAAADLHDGFDLVRSGLIDSFGFLELVGALEAAAGISIDLSEADMDVFTTLGGLLDAVVAGEACEAKRDPPVTRSLLADMLRRLGLGPGDNVMIHSAIQFLGLPENGVATYLDALLDVVGYGATLAVPTFGFAFAHGEDYDPAASVSERMGAFAEYIRTADGSRRSPHPLQSVAVLGPLADEIAGLDTPGAFDPGSPFDRMLELDFKLLLLGASVDRVSMIHYSEQAVGVPYRFWKEFSGRVLRNDGWRLETCRMYARDRHAAPDFSLAPVQRELEAKGLWKSLPLNHGAVSLTSIRDFAETAGAMLARDPWCIVANRDEAMSRLAEGRPRT